MKTNNNTQDNGYKLIVNKGKTAQTILDEANTAKTNASKEYNNDWYFCMIHDAQLACVDENKKHQSDAIESLFTSVSTKNGKRDTSLFFANYMDDPYALQYRISPDKDKPGFFTMTDREVRIPFAIIEKAWCEKMDNKAETLAADGRYGKMIEIYLDNSLRQIAKDMSEEKAKVIIPAMNSLTDERKEYDFSSNSINALEKQLSAIVTAILGEENTIKMRKADVHYILNGMTKAANNNRMAEEKGHLDSTKERAFTNLIFRAMDVRRNNGSYTINSKAKIHREKKEEKVLVEK